MKMPVLNRQSSSSVIRNTLENGGILPPLAKKAKILKRRGAFLWMPVLCSSDIVHGSWWFVWGSFLAMLFPILILINPYIHMYETKDSTLPALSYYATWVMLVISGFFFTVGSFFFVRAFEEPSVTPLLKNWKHFQTDELMAAWLFFLGTIPFVPYCVFWWLNNPGEVLYLGGVIASSIFLFCMYLFVLACYPSEKKLKQVVKPVARLLFGRNHWLIKHIQNDWLAGCWIFYMCTFVCLFGSFVLFCRGAYEESDEEMFIYGLSIIDFFLFLVGCAYFVSGSYPEDINKCYKKRTKSVHIAGEDNKEEEEDDHDGPPTAARRRFDPREREDEDDEEYSVNNVILSRTSFNETNLSQDQQQPSQTPPPPPPESHTNNEKPFSTAIV